MAEYSTDALKDLEKTIDKAITDFNISVPEHEKRIYSELLVLLKDLDTKSGKILNTVKNLKLIATLRTKIKKIVASKQYVKDVKKFTDAFNDITDLQQKYFAQFGEKFGSQKVADILQQQSIDMAAAYLIEGGADQILIPKIEEILRISITTGDSYANLTDQLKEFIVKTDTEGALEKYARQITTDSINQYSANYNALITEDLGFEWYEYRNSLIPHSRDFCIQCVAKRWIHKSEIPELLKGKINNKQIPIYEKTNLPYGMYPETNENNLQIYRGGYNCGHQMTGVPTALVPKSLQKKFI